MNINKPKLAILPFIFLAIAVIANYFTPGTTILWLAAWIVPLFYVRYLQTQQQSRVKAFFLIFIFSSIAAALALRGVVPGGLIISTISAIIGALSYSLLFVLNDKFISINKSFLATFFLPLIMVSFEFFVSQVNPFGTWGFTAYTQYDLKPLIQIVSLTGIWGITFLVYWFASVFNYSWNNNFAWKKIRVAVLITLVVFGAVFAYGIVRMQADDSGELVQISGLTPDTKQSEKILGEFNQDVSLEPEEVYDILANDFTQNMFASITDDLLQRTGAEAEQGSKIIIWSEAATSVSPDKEDELLERAKELAQNKNIYLGVSYMALYKPGILPDGKIGKNKIVFINPQREIETIYLKHIPVPGFEASLSEKGVGDIPVITTPYGKIAMVICYDADFPQFVKQIGKNKADILLIPGNDWEEIAPYHTRLSYFRGIENGVSVFRAANMATMGAVDPYGRVIQEKSTFDFENGTSMQAQVPIKRVNTLYAILGDWFAWVCVFLTGACVLYMVITRKKRAGSNTTKS